LPVYISNCSKQLEKWEKEINNLSKTAGEMVKLRDNLRKLLMEKIEGELKNI
jgi:hypothetical protein